MVADSLRYWATSFGIDGFRFDLGLTLGRERDGFDPGAAFFDVMRQDPVLGQLDGDVVQDGTASGGVGVVDAVDGDQRHDSTTTATP